MIKAFDSDDRNILLRKFECLVREDMWYIN